MKRNLSEDFVDDKEGDEKAMKSDILVIGDDFNCLQIGVQKIEVDRYAVVEGLGVFFFNKSFDEKDLVYSAIDFESPEKINMNSPEEESRYMIRKNGKSLDTLYLINRKPERKSTVQPGEHCIPERFLYKVAYMSKGKGYRMNLDDMSVNPPSEEAFLEKVELLNEVLELSKVLRLSYDGNIQIEMDGHVRWMKSKEVYSAEESYRKLRELCYLPDITPVEKESCIIEPLQQVAGTSSTLSSKDSLPAGWLKGKVVSTLNSEID